VEHGRGESEGECCRRHLGTGVERDRHRTVVDERDVHARPEDTSPDRHTEELERVAEGFVERLRVIGRRGVSEARTVSLACVRDPTEPLIPTRQRSFA